MAGESVTLPGGAKVNRKALIVVGVGGAGFVLWRYWTSAGTSAPAADSEGYADPYGLSGGSGQPEASGISAGGGGGSPTGYGEPSSTGLPASNPAWLQSGVDYLTGTLGYDAQTASGALSRYLAGVTTDTDRSIVMTAIGALGTPPVGNYGWPVITPAPLAPTPTPVVADPAPIVYTAPVMAAPVTAAPVTAAPVAAIPTPASTGGTGTINRPTIGGSTSSIVIAKGQSWADVAKGTGLSYDALRQLNGGKLMALAPGTKVVGGQVVR